MSERGATLRDRVAARATGVLVRARRRVLIDGLTVLGICAVFIGIVVWMSRYMPLWGLMLALGVGGLCVAYGIERWGRRDVARGAVAAASTGGSFEAGPTQEAVRCLNTHRAALAAHLAAMNGSSVESRPPPRDVKETIPPVGRTVFAVGALVGAGLVHWWRDIATRERLAGRSHADDGHNDRASPE